MNRSLRIFVLLLIGCALLLAVASSLHLNRGPALKPHDCATNLKQIALAFRIWADDHGGQFPFSVSTNAEGTMELCNRGADNFDQNAFLHFRAMSNELNTPRLLVCPKDGKKPAADFSGLKAENVSYRMQSAADMTDNASQKIILVQCPLDGNILYTDGTVKGDAEEDPRAMRVR